MRKVDGPNKSRLETDLARQLSIAVTKVAQDNVIITAPASTIKTGDMDVIDIVLVAIKR